MLFRLMKNVRSLRRLLLSFCLIPACILACGQAESVAEELTYTRPDIYELVRSGEAKGTGIGGSRGDYRAYTDPERGGTVKFFFLEAMMSGAYSRVIEDPVKGIVYSENVHHYRTGRNPYCKYPREWAYVRIIQDHRYEGDVLVATVYDYELFLQDGQGNITILETEHREDLRFVPVNVIDSNDYDPNEVLTAKEGEKYTPIRIVVPHELMPPDSDAEREEYDRLYPPPKLIPFVPAPSTTPDDGRPITVGMSAPGVFSADLDIPFVQNSFGPIPGLYEPVVNPRGKYNINVIRELSDFEKAYFSGGKRFRSRGPVASFGQTTERINGMLLLNDTIPDGTQSVTRESRSIPEDQRRREPRESGPFFFNDGVQHTIAIPTEGEVKLALVLDGLWPLDDEGNRMRPYKNVGNMLYEGKLSPGDTIIFKPDDDLVPEEMFFVEGVDDKPELFQRIETHLKRLYDEQRLEADMERQRDEQMP